MIEVEVELSPIHIIPYSCRKLAPLHANTHINWRNIFILNELREKVILEINNHNKYTIEKDEN